MTQLMIHSCLSAGCCVGFRDSHTPKAYKLTRTYLVVFHSADEVSLVKNEKEREKKGDTSGGKGGSYNHSRDGRSFEIQRANL